MNKTRLSKIEKLMKDLPAQPEPNPYATWTLDELKDWYEKKMETTRDTDLYRSLDALSLPELLKLHEQRIIHEGLCL
jgi:hypothetical protein